jgi:hypothetical protein
MIIELGKASVETKGLEPGPFDLDPIISPPKMYRFAWNM